MKIHKFKFKKKLKFVVVCYPSSKTNIKNTSTLKFCLSQDHGINKQKYFMVMVALKNTINCKRETITYTDLINGCQHLKEL